MATLHSEGTADAKAAAKARALEKRELQLKKLQAQLHEMIRKAQGEAGEVRRAVAARDAQIASLQRQVRCRAIVLHCTAFKLITYATRGYLLFWSWPILNLRETLRFSPPLPCYMDNHPRTPKINNIIII